MSFLELPPKYRGVNIIKTLLVNFKFLPFKQAIKLPIFVHGRFTLRSSDGSISIGGRVSPGLINIGLTNRYVETTVPRCIWTINGHIHFSGKLNMYQGSYVTVAHGATLSIGTNNTFFGSNIRIFCFDSITIGDYVRITWDCQIMDSSFHYIEWLDSEKPIEPLTKKVVIGDYVWIGNRSTISKAIIPSNTIIASNSLVNKDFSSAGENILLAGMPASVKTSGLRCVWDKVLQSEIDQTFGYDRTHL